MLEYEVAKLYEELYALREEVDCWRGCARYDPMMGGETRFKGWDRSALDRCRKEYIEKK